MKNSLILFLFSCTLAFAQQPATYTPSEWNALGKKNLLPKYVQGVSSSNYKQIPHYYLSGAYAKAISSSYTTSGDANVTCFNTANIVVTIGQSTDYVQGKTITIFDGIGNATSSKYIEIRSHDTTNVKIDGVGKYRITTNKGFVTLLCTGTGYKIVNSPPTTQTLSIPYNQIDTAKVLLYKDGVVFPFTTIASAITAASIGNVIKLNGHIAVTSQITLKDSVNIDLNGFSIDATGSSQALLFIASGDKCSIFNGTLQNKNTAGNYLLSVSGEMSVNNVLLYHDGVGIANLATTGILNITNSEIKQTLSGGSNRAIITYGQLRIADTKVSVQEGFLYGYSPNSTITNIEVSNCSIYSKFCIAHCDQYTKFQFFNSAMITDDARALALGGSYPGPEIQQINLTDCTVKSLGTVGTTSDPLIIGSNFNGNHYAEFYGTNVLLALGSSQTQTMKNFNVSNSYTFKNYGRLYINLPVLDFSFNTSFNAPVAYPEGSGGGGGISSLNSLSGSTQTFATGTTGTDFGISSASTTHTFNLPTASGTNTGKLSATDWTTFNGKVSTSRTISTTSPISGGGDLSANRTISIADAAADGSTKGAATFTAADFNASSGNISIDYTNGQAATTSVKGFLTNTDWNTFNGKEAGLTFNSPLSRSTNTISIPAAATAQNGYLTSTDWNTFNGKAGLGGTNTWTATNNFTGTLQHNGNTVWDAGNDGVSSGLDADLLQGLGISRIMTSPDTYHSGNWNVSGSALNKIYGVQSLAGTNSPSSAGSAFGTMWTIYPGSLSVGYPQFFANDNQEVWWRQGTSGTWRQFLDRDNQSTQKVQISKAGTLIGTRKNINLIEGTNVTMTVADNSGSDRVDVTINASGGSGLTSLNTLTGSTQTFATGTSGTDFGISSSSTTHTFNLPTASASNRGLLSTANWSTFNGKQDAISAGTTSQYWRGDKTWQTLYAATTIPVSAMNASGTASSSTYLRGDGAWASIAGGGATAVNGLMVNSSNIVLGNDVGGTLATLTSAREIPSAGFSIGISGTGNFGVGTSGPTGKFHSRVADANVNLHRQESTTGDGVSFNIYEFTNGFTTTARSTWQFAHQQSKNLDFYGNDGTNGWIKTATFKPLGDLSLYRSLLFEQHGQTGNSSYEIKQDPGTVQTDVLQIQRTGTSSTGGADAAYTLVDLRAPAGQTNQEATLALSRDGSGGSTIEFLDLYNNGYTTNNDMGLKVQKRSSGTYRDFVISYAASNSLNTEIIRIVPGHRTNDTFSDADFNLITGKIGYRSNTYSRYYDADNSNYIDLKIPTTVSSNYTFTLPTTAGTNNYLLKTDGSGTTSWMEYTEGSEADLGTLTWSAGTAPSGTITKKYRYTKVGKLTTFEFWIDATTAGTSVTSVSFTLPVSALNPVEWTGQGNEITIIGSGGLATTSGSNVQNQSRTYITKTGSNAYNVIAEGSSGSTSNAYGFITYRSQ